MDSADADAPGIFATESAYLDRYVQVGLAGGKVLSVSFPRAPDDDAGADHPMIDRIERYLEGAKDGFEDVNVGLTVPTDHRRVLEALRGVPYGEQVSVERLTALTPDLNPDDEDDRESVRSALAENPIPMVIPDHRVRDGPSGAPPDIEQKLRSLEGL